MRITDSKPTADIRKAARSSRSPSAGAAAFSLLLETEPQPDTSTTPTSSLAAVGNLSMLLAVQTFDDQRQRRREEIGAGRATLDALDSLKLDLLNGRLSPAKLADLSARAHRQRLEVDDPALDRLLAHIEMRAKVELAKLEKNMPGRAL